MVGSVIRTGTLLPVIVEPLATKGQSAIDVRTTVKTRNTSCTLIRFFVTIKQDAPIKSAELNFQCEHVIVKSSLKI